MTGEEIFDSRPYFNLISIVVRVFACRSFHFGAGFLVCTSLSWTLRKARNPKCCEHDTVLSTNCIYATRDLVRPTTHIRKRLQPDVVLARALYMTQALPGWVGVTGHLRKQIIHMLLRKTMKKKTVVFKRIDGLGGSTISKQAQRTYEEFQKREINSRPCIVEDATHQFIIYCGYQEHDDVRNICNRDTAQTAKGQSSHNPNTLARRVGVAV
ncbi:hypothetical protein PCH_Pc22g04520 [Penicillium rubens Wisconsin 54-1255]|uniref:Uncharacterized protein n=1 Tax=Penicillium rubens (strain ATCC 28089 / DSM 1075 / NRRL 1951 / Wisconsin 54-1255) TaxID=500485 RepID=B6HTF5_PENRW|nr:hypothetical protein PCH_Pc22g04520 [Penicillium rubens Wisconsin 54-1255]